MGQTEHGVYDETDDFDPALLHRYYGAANSCGTIQGANPDSSSDSGSSSNSDSDSTSSNSTSSNSASSNSASSNSASSNSSSSSGSDGNSTSSSNAHHSSGSDHNSNYGEVHSDDDSEGEAGSEDGYQEIAKVIAAAQKRNIRHDAVEVAKSAMPFQNSDEMRAYTLALGSALASSEYPAGFGLSEEYESVESYKTGRSSKPLIIPLPYDVWFPRIVVWCKALDLLKRLQLCRMAEASPVL